MSHDGKDLRGALAAWRALDEAERLKAKAPLMDFYIRSTDGERAALVALDLLKAADAAPPCLCVEIDPADRPCLVCEGRALAEREECPFQGEVLCAYLSCPIHRNPDGSLRR
jgi:hypothetical protein